MLTILSKRLRALRKKRDLRQKDIADKLGISESAYGFYEQGKREPSYESLKILAKFYEVTTDYLIGKDDIPWQTVDEVVTPIDPEIAEKLKIVGVEALQLTADLIEKGFSREQLMELLRMVEKMQNPKNEP